MDLSDIKESYVRRKEIPFSSEQKWMAVKCSPKNEVSLSACPLLPNTDSKEELKVSSYFDEVPNT